MINLHNHSTWSDGRYPPEQLIELAVRGGLTHIGISDHFFTLKLADVRTFVDMDRLGAYVREIRALAGRFAGKIGVLVGLEVDWSPRVYPQLEALLSQINQLDYVLFEYVDDRTWYGDSLEHLLSIRPLIGIPVGLAHNKLDRNFASIYPVNELAMLLAQHDMFVELSTCPQYANYGDQDAYSARLWQALQQNGIRFSIGSDTHHAAAEVVDVQEAHLFLQKRGLADRLITRDWDTTRQMWSSRAQPTGVVR
ncbi:MAG: hypothetical protein JW934_24605 [Anaerolineae bacterium]|nr:hypothetical protein [Anaerolineae bacterium]